MKPRIAMLSALLGVGLSFGQPTASVTPADRLATLVSELAKSPDDQAVREKIIKLAWTLEPKPAIPEDAERFNARGKAAVKDAQSPQDFADAAKEFEKATLAAPWLANPYYNLADTQSKAGDYAKAAQNLKFYLLAAPDAQDAKAVKELMYEMEFKAEKLAKANADEQRREEQARTEQKRRDEAAAAERQRQEQLAATQRAEAERIERAREEKRKPLRAKYGSASWAIFYPQGGSPNSAHIDCDGTKFRYYTLYGGARDKESILVDLADMNGDEFESYWSGHGFVSYPSKNTNPGPTRFSISKDGKTITESFRSPVNNALISNVYKRQK